MDTGLPVPNLMAYILPEEMVGLENCSMSRMLDLELDAPCRARQRQAGGRLYPQVYAIAACRSPLRVELNRAGCAASAGRHQATSAGEYLAVQPHAACDADADSDALVLTPTPVPCTDGMAYVADLNCDDRNMKAPPPPRRARISPRPGAAQPGNCSWDRRLRFDLRPAGRCGRAMGGEPVLVGRIVLPGQTIDVSVLSTAPQAPGVYQGFCR